LAGSVGSLIVAGTMDELTAAKKVFVCEGPSDLFAL
jgi:hypothetical protein